MVAVLAKNWNLADGALILNGAIIKGGAPGEFITAARDNDFVEAETASDGSQATFSIKNDKMGTVTINLQQTSDANSILTALNTIQESIGAGSFSLQYVNNTDGAKIIATDCRIIKPADYTGADSVSPRSWTIKALSLEFK